MAQPRQDIGTFLEIRLNSYCTFIISDNGKKNFTNGEQLNGYRQVFALAEFQTN